MEFSNYCFDTLCVQGSPEAKSVDLSGAISVPLVQSATFAHPGLGESTGYDYSRLSNPTRKFLEETVAALDGAKFGFAFSCGMAAETAFFSMLESKSHIISSDDIYGGSLRLFNTIVKKQGIETTFVDTSSLEQIEKAFRPDTKILS